MLSQIKTKFFIHVLRVNEVPQGLCKERVEQERKQSREIVEINAAMTIIVNMGSRDISPLYHTLRHE